MRLCARVLATFLLGCALMAAAPVTITVHDQANLPAPQVKVAVRRGAELAGSADTDESGKATFIALEPGHYSLSATKEGFEPVEREFDVVPSEAGSVDLILVPALREPEKIEVHDTAGPVGEQSSSAPAAVPPQVARELPNRPATVADALPLAPGVVRSSTGGLQISGNGEHRSALIVNSADVTDPATGQFGLTVPIDVVETLNVYQTPFLAEYGRFSGGLVSVETKRGGDRWKWELNDPFPDFRIRSYHMNGIKDATPRLNFGGPLIPGKLYFTEGLEYDMRKTEAYTLQWPNNQKKQEGVNSFSQLDWIVSGRQLVTGSLHLAPQKEEYANINFLNPEPTSPNASTRNYTGTVGDRLTLGGGLLENTVSITRFDVSVWGQGSADLTIAPWGNSGNYFQQQNRVSTRAGWSATYSFATVNFGGTHNFKAGSYISGSSDRGQVYDHPTNVLNGSSQLVERITFLPGTFYNMKDTDYAVFGQDHWIISPRLAVDLGIRAESQEISESFRVAPRVGVAWTPFATGGTVVRAGYGLFYDRVPLNVYSFADYPSPVVTMYDGFGGVTGGPYSLQNLLGVVTVRPPWVFQQAVAGNFSPRSDNWRAEVEQPVNRSLKLRVGYMRNDGSGLVILNRSIDPLANTGLDQLSGSGQSRYHQFDVTASWRVTQTSPLFFSYVRSSARGDLNDFANFLGSFPIPLLRPNEFSYLPTNLPNRFLAWGNIQLPRGFRIAPVLEYRNGFPYAVTDALQNYVGVPYATRFPNFFSADARVSKDLQVNPKYKVRLSLSGFNLT
ncbi:MAG: carboxypeptidase regulatory-like domain-containing protein, partial [Acidobacteriia bacterium]|nr:carboxypeptidase regulatory-like domain-containing protein [Terriglobia bacterium]